MVRYNKNNNNNEVLIRHGPLVLPELSTLHRKKDNNNEVIIKHEPLVLQELGMLYRKKKRLEPYNSNKKLIHP